MKKRKKRISWNWDIPRPASQLELEDHAYDLLMRAISLQRSISHGSFQHAEQCVSDVKKWFGMFESLLIAHKLRFLQEQRKGDAARERREALERKRRKR